MAGQSAVRVDSEAFGGAAVAVKQPGAPGLMLIDGRVPHFSDEQVEKAALDLATRSGPIVAAVRTKTESSWDEVRAEVNRLAGGEASARVKILAHHALRAHQALELQTLAAGLAFGTGDELAEKHMRNQAGLAVVASEALNKAYEAAREEGKAAKGSATDQLFSRLGMGHGRTGVDVGVGASSPGSENTPARPPVLGGGGQATGSLPSQTAPIPKGSP